MDDQAWLADRFDENRAHLRSVASRMLGSGTEADDAVQEAWLRLSRAGASGVENLGGWLTTVVSRVCLDMLRTRASRREDSLEASAPVPTGGAVVPPGHTAAHDPEDQAVMADAVGAALLVVLDTLSPAERLAYVLHDLFDVPFEEIATIVDRSPVAARQLASRARRRVRGAAGPARRAGSEHGSDDGLTQQRRIVEAFLAASRRGDFDALLAMLAPDVVARADAAAVESGADTEVRGATAVARTFAGRARAAQPALLDGAVGLVWAQHGVARVAFRFTVEDERIVAIELVADAAELARLDVTVLDDAG